MLPTVRKKYSPLGEVDTLPTKPNSCSFYLVMLTSFIVIVSFISTYLYTQYYVALAPKSNLFLIKDLHRAVIYSAYSDNETPRNIKIQHQRERYDDTYERKMVCYYNIPSSSLSDLQPNKLDPHLCSHINIAFASVVNKQIYIDNNFEATLRNVILLKAQNSKLKLLVSIGGAGNDCGFPDMVVDHASRKVFIKSTKDFLKKHQIDGIDLDWEFPGIGNNATLVKRQKQHFTQLLYEIRKEFKREKKNYLLTVAVAAPEIIVDDAYYVKYMNDYVDFINIMTYDFHFYTPRTPFTGLNSPLYARKSEELYMASLNINYTTNLYLSLGMDRSKIVIGIPTYGHSFLLVNRDNGGITSPASGYGSVGSLGFASLPQICSFLKTRGKDAQITFDQEAKAPYIHKDYEWISFENQESVEQKANFIKNNNLGGAMIYSLNCDDYSGVCALGNLTFPLTRSVLNYL